MLRRILKKYSINQGCLPLFLGVLISFLVSHDASAQKWNPFSEFGAAEQVRSEIRLLEEKLKSLPKAAPVERPWTLGMQSEGGDRENVSSVLEIGFHHNNSIDFVVLFPAILKRSNALYEPLGFPKRFKLEVVFTDGSSEAIADYSDEDYPLHGIGPQIFSCKSEALVTGLRLTILRLSSHEVWKDRQYRFAMSEIMAFSGQENVALYSKNKYSEPTKTFPAWELQAVTDGLYSFSPTNENVVADNITYRVRADKLELIFDLGKRQDINAIRLWPYTFAHYHNFAGLSGSGFPTAVKVSKSMSLEGPYINYTELLPFRIPIGSNPYELRFRKGDERFVKLTLSDPVIRNLYDANLLGPIITLSEIELLFQGVCVSKDTVPRAVAFAKGTKVWPQKEDLPYLTDGLMDKGEIWPLRQWILETSKRFELERELTKLEQALTVSIQEEKYAYQTLILLFTGVIIILALLAWILKLRGGQKVSKVRERIASDLHDHVGANLSSIAVYLQLIGRTIKNPTDEQRRLLDTSTRTTQETAKEASHIVKFLESRFRDEPFTDLLYQSARRILRGIEFSYDFQEKSFLQKLNQSKKWDLLLFVKEALNNVVKHSEADFVDLKIFRRGANIRLEVSDDGSGVRESELPLVHLEKRAKRLEGKMNIESSPGMGTKIVLEFK